MYSFANTILQNENRVLFSYLKSVHDTKRKKDVAFGGGQIVGPKEINF